MSHGWGSSALVAMQETLLGVRFEPPDAAGTVRAVVSPPSAGLDRAEGSVPTVAGPVRVSWQRRGKGMTMALTVPPTRRRRYGCPPARRRACGRAAAVAATPGVRVVSVGRGAVVLAVGSGTYRFTSTLNRGHVADGRYEVQTVPAGGVCPLTR